MALAEPVPGSATAASGTAGGASVAQGAAAGATGANAQAQSAEDFKAKYERLAQEHQNLRSLYGRQTQELGQLRQRATAPREPEPTYDTGGYDAYGEQEPQPTRGAGGRFKRSERAEAEAYRAALDGFKLDLFTDGNRFAPDASGKSTWPEYYQKAMTYLQEAATDPFKAEQCAVYDQYGNINYRASLHRALDRVELEATWAARQAAAEKRTELNVAGDANRAAAMISGSGATGGGDIVDVSKMTPEQMREAGLITIDERNPPSWARGPAFGVTRK